MVVAPVGVSHRHSPASQNIQRVFALAQNVSAPGLELDNKGNQRTGITFAAPPVFVRSQRDQRFVSKPAQSVFLRGRQGRHGADSLDEDARWQSLIKRCVRVVWSWLSGLGEAARCSLDGLEASSGGVMIALR